METVLRVAGALLILYFIFAGLAYLLSSAQTAGGQTPLHARTPVLSSPMTSLDTNGTITYFREGTGQLNAYFVYPDGDSVSTKIINFSPQSRCLYATLERCPRSAGELRAQLGNGPIHVVGTVLNEELHTDMLERLPG